MGLAGRSWIGALISLTPALAAAGSASSDTAAARQGVEFGLDLTVGPRLEARGQMLTPWTVAGARLGLEVMGSPKSAPYFGAHFGLGSRAEWRVGNDRNAVLISPGVAWYIVFHEAPTSDASHSWWDWNSFRGPLDDIHLISAGLDLGLRHVFSPGFAMVFGGRVASTLSLGERDSSGHDTCGEVKWVGGLFVGARH